MLRILVLPGLITAFAASISMRGCSSEQGPQPPGLPQSPALALELQASRTALPPGGETELALTVTNQSGHPVKLDFRSGQTYDLVISREGEEVWRWSYDRFFTQALRSITMEPGESMSFQETWEGRDNAGNTVPPGEYETVGILATIPERRAEPLRITVTR